MKRVLILLLASPAFAAGDAVSAGTAVTLGVVVWIITAVAFVVTIKVNQGAMKEQLQDDKRLREEADKEAKRERDTLRDEARRDRDVLRDKLSELGAKIGDQHNAHLERAILELAKSVTEAGTRSADRMAEVLASMRDDRKDVDARLRDVEQGLIRQTAAFNDMARSHGDLEVIESRLRKLEREVRG